MAVRRNVRLRREYLYRKSLEGKERESYDRKQQFKQALAEGKAIPTEIRTRQKSLEREIEYDDAGHEVPQHQLIDDEYKTAGLFDPKIAVTTCRDPSARLKKFVQEIRLIFPNALRINRGNHTVQDLMDSARSNEFTDVLLITETRGEPDGLVVCHLPYGPTAYFSLQNAVLRHDIADRATVSEAYPQLIFDQFETNIGQRAMNILKHLFPIPKPDSKRIMTFANNNDFISFRHHTYQKVYRPVTQGGGNSKQEIQLSECGPRFELQLYQIKLGTMEQKEAENEWVYRPYLNTTKKRNAL